MRTINSCFLHIAGGLLMALSSGVAMAQTQAQSNIKSSEMASMTMDHAHMAHQDMPAHSMSHTDAMHAQLEQLPQFRDKQKSKLCQDQSVQHKQKSQCKNSSKHSKVEEKTHAQH